MLDGIAPKPHLCRPQQGPRPPQGPATPGSCRETVITNALGLHLRAADRFVRLAQQFQATVRVAHGANAVDGKSILDLATLAAACGDALAIEASGPDAEAALEALTALVAAGFHEAESSAQ